jgi:hypothetical protein
VIRLVFARYDGLVVEQRPLKRAHIQRSSSSNSINQESEPNPLVVHQEEEEISPHTNGFKISGQNNKTED